MLVVGNWGYLHSQDQGKLASVSLQRFSSIFESTLSVISFFYFTSTHFLESVYVQWHDIDF